MHFILTAIGSYGDVHPMVGLGKTLKARGHRVSIVTNPYFADVVSRAGVDLLPLGDIDDYRRLTDHPNVWNPRRAPAFIFGQVVAPYLPQLYALLQQNHVGGETVIVAHMLDAASPIMREKHGTCVARVIFSPCVFWSPNQPPALGLPSISPRLPGWWNQLQFNLANRVMVDRVLRRPINRFRASLGIHRISDTWGWWFENDMNLCLFPSWFAPPQRGWPRVQSVGFPLWDASDSTPLSADVESFLAGGEPPIAFAAGTANNQAASYFRVAANVCQRLGRRGILLTKYPCQLPPSLPHSVKHVEFTPLTQLLPSTAAFVHHGGVGSSSQALAAGVPQLVRPLAFDQFDNAQRLRTLGVAEEIRPKRFTEARVAESLRRLTTSAKVAANCTKYSAELEANNALGQACKQLEALAKK